MLTIAGGILLALFAILVLRNLGKIVIAIFILYLIGAAMMVHG
jgi:hypothetical protein